MKQSLKGEWYYRLDRSDIGNKEEWFRKKVYDNTATLPTFSLPNNWNLIPELDKYEGIIWYFQEITLDDLMEQNKQIVDLDYFIHFGAANYLTDVWINERHLGQNEGGYLPFEMKIPSTVLDDVNQKLFIVIRISNIRKVDGIPCRSFDWYNWGGLYREFYIDSRPKIRIDWIGVSPKLPRLDQATLEVKCDLVLNADSIPQNIHIKYQLYEVGIVNHIVNEAETEINLLTGFTNQTPLILKGEHSHLFDVSKSLIHKLNFQISLPNPSLWTPDTPNLYLLRIDLDGVEAPYWARFGVREIKQVGLGLYLNKKRLRLRGSSLHEEQIPFGRNYPLAMRRADLRNMKALGFNTLRTGHYSHAEMTYHIADEEGLVLLEEIPVYWGINWKDPRLLKLAAKMYRTMIRRDFNHPSIIMWSAGNEISVGDRACSQFIDTLLRLGKRLDQSRLISFVMEPIGSFSFNKNLQQHADVFCLNMYCGWYYLTPYNLNFLFDAIRAGAMDKPWLMTEFGAGTKYGYHVPLDQFEKFSEERQASVLGHEIKVMNSKQGVAGWYIWIYRDFRSHMRTNKFQKGFNRKGVVSDINEKKMIARWMPKLVNQQLRENHEIRHYRYFAKAFQLAAKPFFKLISMIANLVQHLQSKIGDKYYDS